MQQIGLLVGALCGLGAVTTKFVITEGFDSFSIINPSDGMANNILETVVNVAGTGIVALGGIVAVENLTFAYRAHKRQKDQFNGIMPSHLSESATGEQHDS
jgi:hypothetical protein